METNLAERFQAGQFLQEASLKPAALLIFCASCGLHVEYMALGEACERREVKLELPSVKCEVLLNWVVALQSLQAKISHIMK